MTTKEYMRILKRAITDMVFKHNMANNRSKQDRAGLKRATAYLNIMVRSHDDCPHQMSISTFRSALKKCPFPVRYNFHRSRLIFVSDADKMQFLMEAYQ